MPRDKPTQRLYNVWRDMIRRCHNQNRHDYPRYGGIGVFVCDRWRESFDQFLQDMGTPAEGMQLDRIDSARGYEPGNCRWVTPRQNARNRRCTKFVEFRGERISVPDLAERHNVELTALYHRLRLGWDLERAVSQPGTRGYFARPTGAKSRSMQ